MRSKTLRLIAFLFALSQLLIACGTTGQTSKSIQEATITVNQTQMQAIDNACPKDVVFFTSPSSPIKSFDGLQLSQVAMYGGELISCVEGILNLNSPVGLQVIGTGNNDAKFNLNSNLRLFITHEALAKDITDGGGIKIKIDRGGS